MKKKLFLFFAAGMVLLSSCGTKDENTAGEKEDPKDKTDTVIAKDFVSDAGQFSIVFKNIPHEQSKEVPTILNTHVTMYALSCSDDKVQDKSYMVAYCDYPETVMTGADVGQLLKDFKNGVIKKLDATITQENMGKFQDHDCIDFAASGPQLHTAYKMVIAGNRLYQVSILQPGEPVAQQDIDAFIGSFKILGE